MKKLLTVTLALVLVGCVEETKVTKIARNFSEAEVVKVCSDTTTVWRNEKGDLAVLSRNNNLFEKPIVAEIPKDTDLASFC